MNNPPQKLIKKEPEEEKSKNKTIIKPAKYAFDPL